MSSPSPSSSSSIPSSNGETAQDVFKPVVAVCIAFIVLDTLFVGLRFVSRQWIKRLSFGWDDCLIIPAYMVNMASNILGLYIAHFIAIGNPSADQLLTSPDQLVVNVKPSLKCVFATLLLEVAGYTLSRLSLCFLYLRIFNGRTVRICTWILIATLVAIWISYSFAAIFICDPVPFFWDKLIPGGTCGNINLYYRAWGLPAIITDAAMMIIPLPVIWRLKATKLRKIVLTMTFLTGVVGLIASSLLWAAFVKYDATLLHPRDDAPLIYWAIVEDGTYLIAACLPTLYPLLRACVPTAMTRRLDQALLTTDPNNHRHRRYPGGVPARHSSSKGGRDRGFSRLAEHGSQTVSITEVWQQDKVTRSEACMSQKGRRVHGEVRSIESSQEMGEVALDDLARLRNGHGIGVTTEIIVTQEQRFQEIIGL